MRNEPSKMVLSGSSAADLVPYGYWLGGYNQTLSAIYLIHRKSIVLEISGRNYFSIGMWKKLLNTLTNTLYIKFSSFACFRLKISKLAKHTNKITWLPSSYKNLKMNNTSYRGYYRQTFNTVDPSCNWDTISLAPLIQVKYYCNGSICAISKVFKVHQIIASAEKLKI